MTPLQLPAVVLLGTGGTIAATAALSTTLADYSVTEGVESLLSAVPEISTLARLRCRQVFNVDSRSITNKMLLKLAAVVNKEAANPEVDGIVITHGTDTLEETAWFLNLTIKSRKPVVMVGAMRPGTALSADGPLNLYNAVLLAAHAQASGHGVMVLLNDQISAARFVSKTNTTQVDAFRSADHGYLGQAHNGTIQIFQSPMRFHTAATDFSMAGVSALPEVDIVYDHQNAPLHFYEACIAAGSKGIVVACTGNGSLSPNARKGVRLARKNGIYCVRSSRVGSGTVSGSRDDKKDGLVTADSLNPQKARILLMLALTATSKLERIQWYFDNY
ncbi:MAG TPA: asparaginase [Candidimonas sp.]|nr:asparaginase [Candidimonas sp.]